MPLTWVSLFFLGGIILASIISFPIWAWILFSLVAFGIYLISRKIRTRISHPPSGYFTGIIPSLFLFLTLLFLGSVYYQSRQPKVDAFHTAFYNDREYEMLVTGYLEEPPDYRDNYTNLKLNVEYIDSGSGDLPVSGLILVRVDKNHEYEYGQRLRVRGELKTPPENEDFSYRDYLAREGIHSYMSSADVTKLPGSGGNFITWTIYKFKELLLERTYRLYNDPEASLLAGILFGVDTGLPSRLQDAFKNTGTSHIIAISGFNIAIIAGIFFSIFKYITNERLGALFAIIGIFLYSFLVGGDAAVMRAAFMGSISLLARQLGRRNMGLNALMVVALIMALINPLVLWDVGFQLSFFATLGLILYAEPFSNFTANLISKLSKHDTSTFTNIINENVVLTFAAQLTTIPIMAYHFKRISLISLIANPFILPVQPAVMILGGIAVFVSLILQPLGQLLAWIAWPFPAYTIRVVELFDRVPNGTIFLGDSSIWWAVTFYIVLLTTTFNWNKITEWFKSLAGSIRAVGLTGAFTILFICMLIFWRAAGTAGDGQFHLIFLEAGSADAVLIQTPEGRNILINGGSSTTDLSNELGSRLPFFSRKLDWLIIASTQEDELSALPRVIERYPPDNVLWTGNVQASFSSRALDEYFAEHEIPINHAVAGQKLELGGGAFIEVQAEGPRGAVLLIQDGSFRALLPIGISEGMYESIEYGNTIGPVDVLLLSDSGYAPSNPVDIFENLNPQLVVISVGAGDLQGRPSQDVLDALAEYSVLRTDRNGWIDVTTDGNEMRVAVERGE